MEVKGLLLDPASETPVLLLQAVAGTVVLPIWIGQVEANAIAMALEGIREPRPMTHDLMQGILRELAVELRSRRSLGAARRDLLRSAAPAQGRARSVQVDARPSDAIAMAVRTGASIWVAQAVIEEALRARSGDGGGGGRAPARVAREGASGRPRQVHDVDPQQNG